MQEDNLEVIQLQNNDIAKNVLPPIYPFVKWAGGKTQLLQQLYESTPAKFNRYLEPFLGGGALFFYLISVRSEKFRAYLSDINSELINSYKVVKDNVEELIDLLKMVRHYFCAKS
jgi:DNA adenine methylase